MPRRARVPALSFFPDHAKAAQRWAWLTLVGVGLLVATSHTPAGSKVGLPAFLILVFVGMCEWFGRKTPVVTLAGDLLRARSLEVHAREVVSCDFRSRGKQGRSAGLVVRSGRRERTRWFSLQSLSTAERTRCETAIRAWVRERAAGPRPAKPRSDREVERWARVFA